MMNAEQLHKKKNRRSRRTIGRNSQWYAFQPDTTDVQIGSYQGLVDWTTLSSDGWDDRDVQMSSCPLGARNVFRTGQQCLVVAR